MVKWLRKISKPPLLVNDEDVLAASLLHTILLIFAIAGFFVPLLLNIVAVVDPNDQIPFELTTLLMGLVVPVLALGLMELMHRGLIRLASLIMTGTLFLLTTSTILSFRGTRDTASSMYILVIAMAGLLLGGRAAIIFMGLSLLATLGVYMAEVNGLISFEISETPGIIEWMIFAIVLLLISVLLRFAFETLTNAFRQARKANEELEDIQLSLEERVAARTRDLELAAEIGRHLSQVQESEEIVTEAVEMIKSRFNLYYTQIYLVDSFRSNLQLRAGTGIVGRQLRQLGHRLPINGSSINGTAVLKKKPVVVPDTASSPIFRQNPLLPDTRSEMAVPLVVSEEVIGVLNIQSQTPDSLTEESLTAFEALAGQIAISLDNARLFSEAAEAQDTVETLAQRLTRSGWDSYLNAIDREESISYTYNTNFAQFVEAPTETTSNPSFSVPIKLGATDLGKIEVQGSEWRTWQKADQDLVSAIGQRVAQQIENLRLLSETEYYRREAEDATRRLVRDGWQAYIEDQKDESGGFLYNQQQVVPIAPNGSSTEKQISLVKSLTVRGESVGQFEIEGVSEEDEATNVLVEAVAERLSAHIENLRLSNQTEVALKSTEQRAEEMAVINQIAQAVSRQTEQTLLLQTVYEQVQRIMPVDAFSVTSYEAATEMIHYLMVMDEGQLFKEPPTSLGSGAISQVIQGGKPILLNRTAAELDGIARKQEAVLIGNVQRFSASMIYVPLQIGSETIGGLSVQSYELNAYSQEEVDLLVSVANHVAVALENARLFEETQTTLAETELLYTIGTHINQALTLEDLVKVVGIPGLANGASSAGLFHFELGDDGRAEWMEMRANWAGDGETVLPIGTRLHLRQLPLAAAELYTPNEPMLIGDIAVDDRVDEDARSLLQGLDTKSIAIIPMQQLGTWIGTLIIRWKDRYDFGLQEHRLYNSLARQMSTALSNQLLLTETQDRAAQLEKITNVETALSQAQDEVEMLDALSTFFDKDQAVSIHYLVEEDNLATAYTVAHWEHGRIQGSDEMLFQPFDIKLHAGFELGLKHPDRVTFIHDIQSSEIVTKKAAKEAKKIGFRSVLVVPLRSAGRWQGFISIKWVNPYDITADEIGIWEKLHEALAANIASRRAYLAQQDALSETAVLYETGAQLSVARSYEEVLTVIRNNTILGQNITNVSIMLFEQAWQQDDNIPSYADVLAFWSENVPVQAKMRFHFEDYLSSQELLQQADRPFVIQNVADSNQLDQRLKKMLVKGFNTNTFALFPMFVRGDSIGYVNAMYPEQTSLSEQEFRRTEAIIQQAGVAIQGLRNLDQAEKQAMVARNRSNELAILNEMGRSLTALVDMDTILENVYRYTARLMDATNFYVSFYDGKHDEVTFALDIRGKRVMKNVGTRKAGNGLTEHIIHTKKPLLIPESVEKKLDELGIEQIGPASASWLGVPLMVGSQVIGVIGLQNWDMPRTYNDQHLRLLTSVAAQAAIAVENARLFEQIQARARRERILREVTAKVRSGSDADTVMRTAVAEIGRALGRRTFVYLNESDTQEPKARKEDAYGD